MLKLATELAEGRTKGLTVNGLSREGAGRARRDVAVAAVAAVVAAVVVISMVGPATSRFFDSALEPAEVEHAATPDGYQGRVVGAASHGSLPVVAAPVAAVPVVEPVVRSVGVARVGGTSLVPRRTEAASAPVTEPDSLFLAAATEDSFSLEDTADQVTASSTGDITELEYQTATVEADKPGRARSAVAPRGRASGERSAKAHRSEGGTDRRAAAARPGKDRRPPRSDGRGDVSFGDRGRSPR